MGPGGRPAAEAAPAKPANLRFLNWSASTGKAFDEADVPRPPKTRRRPLLSVRSSPRKLITGTPARFLGQLPMVELNTTGPASAPLIDLGPGSIISLVVRSAAGIVLFLRSGTAPGK